MNNILSVRITKNYGREAIYPANEIGETFTRLTGNKTLSRDDIANIKNLGFTVNIEQPEL